MCSETWDADAISSIEMRAGLIRNPVRRLRYLRRMTQDGLPVAVQRSPRRLRVPPLLLVAVFLAFPAGYSTETREPPSAMEPWAADLTDRVPAVWLVDRTEEFETHSNGLRIEHMSAASTHPRKYVALPIKAGGGEAVVRTEPVGIVFHTTESQLVDFEEQKSVALQRVGRYLLDYVRENRCYHFVVDRFGRVHRTVEESDAANHAGWSVWADGQWAYVKLNESFLGIAFETQSQSNGAAVTSAQIHAGRVLVEMLRSRYHIPAANCVTHAQVSVNPSNLRAGYHTDWERGFPFRSLGLPDNYAAPLASVLLFGFDADGFPEGSGAERGMLAAETQLQREALSRKIPMAEYRRVLRSRWRETLSALKSDGSEKERGL